MVAAKHVVLLSSLFMKVLLQISAVLHYSSWKDKKYSFICSNELCGHTSLPYEKDFSKAACSQCSMDMVLTSKHTIWLTEKEPT